MIDRLTPCNFTLGRGDERIEGAIMHWTVGTLAASVARFFNCDERASAHFIIDRDGQTYRIVREEDTAWHAGDWLTNERTVGIEHVGGPAWDGVFTDFQYAASSGLIRDLSRRFDFPIDAEHVRPHNAISATQCPGTLDIDRIVRGAAEEEEMTDQEWVEKYLRLADPDIRKAIKAAADAAVGRALSEASTRLGAPRLP